MINHLNSALGYLASGISLRHPVTLLVLFALGAVSEFGFPLFFSLEIILFFTSYAVGPLSAPILWIVLMLLAGRELGANLLYLLSRGLGGRLLDWLQRRSPRVKKGVENFKVRLNKNLPISVALLRLTPGLLQVPSITAGGTRLRQLEFAAGVAISSLAYDFILVFLGFGARLILPHIGSQPKTFLFAGLMCMVALVWLVLFLLRRRITRKKR